MEVGQATLLFSSELDPARTRDLAVLLDPTTRFIAQVIVSLPGAKQSSLCRLAGVARKVFSVHARRLVSANLVARKGAIRPSYEATDRLHALLRDVNTENQAPA